MNQATQSDSIITEHDIVVSATLKTLTAQRDSALNTVANVQGEKAVLEHRLKVITESAALLAQEKARLEMRLSKSEQANSELRVVVANLQSQLPPQADAPIDPPAEDSASESNEKKNSPEDALPESVKEESKGLLERARTAVAPLLGK